MLIPPYSPSHPSKIAESPASKHAAFPTSPIPAPHHTRFLTDKITHYQPPTTKLNSHLDRARISLFKLVHHSGVERLRSDVSLSDAIARGIDGMVRCQYDQRRESLMLKTLQRELAALVEPKGAVAVAAAKLAPPRTG